MSLLELSKSETLFFDLLCSGLWNTLPQEDYSSLIEKDWEAIFSLARKQAVIGNVFDGISKLPKEHHPPLKIKLQWIALVQKIEQQNSRLNDYSVEIAEQFRKDGFRNIILKGQGLAIYYPNPLHRQSGDIDIYMQGGRKEILEYLKPYNYDRKKITRVHIGFSTPTAEVECHVMCSRFYDPFKNKRLQKKLTEWVALSFDNYISLGKGQVSVPINEMNQIYVLQHIYRHLFASGIGLRQLCDYAMLMEYTYDHSKSEFYQDNLGELGLTSFAKALFFILTVYLGYPKEKLPLNITGDKLGPVLFDEIMQGGNFGQHDIRKKATKKDSWKKHLLRIKRISIFTVYFPLEVLFTPISAINHYIWRKWHGYL